ncbi:amidohydrolase family protein [Phenylobacterium sp.]|uniref:amidohydrolase family protein n=1 Tax=Phenylobacterium sp. TaxID=1871053 RepID=UPI002F922BAC
MILRDVEVDGRPGVDVRIERGGIAQIGRGLRGPDELDGQGGALIPGLVDHHIHLFGLAARADSVVLDGVTDARGFAARIETTLVERPPGAWVRVTGYHETIAGQLTRAALDDLAPAHRVRVQHQTGALWVLNSLAWASLGPEPPPGSDPDKGWLWRADAWLRGQLAPDPPPLAPIGGKLAGYGITALTDASVTTDAASAARLAEAHREGALPQRLTLMSGAPLEAPADGAFAVGPVKVLLDDADLPDLDDFADRIGGARSQGRAVAVHCVTAGELALTLAAFESAGARPGDRIEHGGVIPRAAIAQLKALGLTVVTQPAFVRERGDRYLAQVDPAEQPDLYRCASLRTAGVPVAGSSDAPYASPDPWAGIAAAIERRTLAGRTLGAAERVDAAAALAMYLTAPAEPGGSPRRVAVGAPADLCLLKVPLQEALATPSAELVRATLVGGRVVG